MNKKNLLSIGEVSKITGASIKSLRYYERIKILEPAYVDPDSSYRYYTFDQMELIGIIMFCVELDIPLKKLTEFIDEDKKIDFSALLVYGKKIAKEKLKKIQKGLRLISMVEKKIALYEKYHNEKIYLREIPEKCCCVVPVPHSLDESDQFEILWKILDLISELGYSEDDYENISDYGTLLEFSENRSQVYAFVELPEHREGENIKIIPGGTYFCTQSTQNQMENVKEIFSEQIGNKPFLAIETEIFAGKYEINKPIKELRAICVP